MCDAVVSACRSLTGHNDCNRELEAISAWALLLFRIIQVRWRLPCCCFSIFGLPRTAVSVISAVMARLSLKMRVIENACLQVFRLQVECNPAQLVRILLVTRMLVWL